MTERAARELAGGASNGGGTGPENPVPPIASRDQASQPLIRSDIARVEMP